LRLRPDGGTSDGLLGLVDRLRRVARDPAASAIFFNAFCVAFLEKLVCSTRDPVNAPTGILGNVSAHYGIVEEQGRGSLHLHVLLWLHDSPGPVELFARLEADPSFNIRFMQYFDDTICESLPPGVSIKGRDERGRETKDAPRESEPERLNPYRSPRASDSVHDKDKYIKEKETKRSSLVDASAGSAEGQLPASARRSIASPSNNEFR